MATWLGYLWARIRGSLWFVPALMSAAAMALAFLCAWLDTVVAGMPGRFAYLYHGDAESARLLLSTVAGSMITVAGVSFSVTMVALSLASSQLGPRLLVNFMRDRGNQTVLGVFIATFLFCLLALGSMPSDDGSFVSVSTSAALVLAVLSLVTLIYFIHHIAVSMQADHVIRSVAAELRKNLHTLFPEDADDVPEVPADRAMDEPVTRLGAARSGYLQVVDEAGLVTLAEKQGVRLRVLRRPGHFVTEAVPLVEVAGSPGISEDVAGEIRRAFIIGDSRTADQDPEYGIHQLVEIALRALSPGINDPFTAVTCIDHLGGILASVADLPARPPLRIDGSGEPRLFLDPIDFQGVLDAAFNQIRQGAVGNAAVSIRLLEALTTIVWSTSDPDRLAAVERQAAMIREQHEPRLRGIDLAAFRRRLDELVEVISRRPGSTAGKR